MKQRSRQTGAVLVVGLLLLLVMTILGLASMGDTALQERMAGNNRQKHVAMQAAEAALRDAEGYLLGLNLPSDLSMFNGNNGLYSRVTSSAAPLAIFPPSISLGSDADWLETTPPNARVIGTAIAGITQQPRYMIEYVGRIGDPPLDPNDPAPDLRPYAFRITAMGWGGNTTARSLLLSHFRI